MRGLGPAHQAVLRGLQAITITGLCLLPAAGAGAVCVDGVRKGGNTNALIIADARHKAAVFFRHW